MNLSHPTKRFGLCLLFAFSVLGCSKQPVPDSASKKQDQARAKTPPKAPGHASSSPDSPLSPQQPAANAETSAPKPVVNAETSAPKPVVKKKYLTVLLRDGKVKKLGSTGLTAQISLSSHKIRAPIARLAILVRNKKKQAEVHWRIESGKVDRTWQPIAGRRFDGASNSYVQETLPGWEIRLESIRSIHSNGSPRSVAVSFRKKKN